MSNNEKKNRLINKNEGIISEKLLIEPMVEQIRNTSESYNTSKS